MKIAHVACWVSIVLCGTVWAGGAAFNYRDRMTDVVLAGHDQKLRFEFYAEFTGGQALFKTNQTVAVAANGDFCAEVGGTASLFATTNDLYLAVWVPATTGGEPTKLLHGKRRKLMAVPTAIFAQNASEARDGFIVRGSATLGGLQLVGDGAAYDVDENGHLSVEDFDTEKLSADDGSLGGSLSVGKDLTLQKSMAMSGAAFTASNATLRAHSVNAQTLVMPGNVEDLVPKGIIMMWYGDANKVPAGWALCDGSNGTPDLTGRFIVGASRSGDDWNAYRKTGGARSVTLSVEQMPQHHHDYFGDDQLVTHAEKANEHSGYDAESGKSGDSAWFKTGETGGSKAHENRPPFRAVYYIMKVK